MGEGGGGRGGAGEFEVSRHASKQIATAQKLYNRRGLKYMFSGSSLFALFKTFMIGSIGIHSKVLASPLEKICGDGVVFTWNESAYTSFGVIKVCSINFEPTDIDLCSACHAYPISRGAWIISILFIVNRFTLGLN